MYFYYAYIENDVCVDIERTRRQKTDLLDCYIEVTEYEYNAYVVEDTASEYYIIGKSFENGAWVYLDLNFYAVLNEKYIVVNFVRSLREINDPHYIGITKEQYTSREYMHTRYNLETHNFDVVSFDAYADADTTTVSVNGTTKTLQEVINELNEMIRQKPDGTLSPVDILAMLSQVDGASSCLDADLLDGKDSSEFVTKNDLAGYVTKNDLKSYCTTQQLINVENNLSKQYVFGYYSGNVRDRNVKEIRLGFRPKAVLVVPIDGEFYNSDGDSMGGLFVDGFDCGNGANYGVQICDTGFIAYSYESDKLGLARGEKMYIAFK